MSLPALLTASWGRGWGQAPTPQPLAPACPRPCPCRRAAWDERVLSPCLRLWSVSCTGLVSTTEGPHACGRPTRPPGKGQKSSVRAPTCSPCAITAANGWVKCTVTDHGHTGSVHDHHPKGTQPPKSGLSQRNQAQKMTQAPAPLSVCLSVYRILEQAKLLVLLEIRSRVPLGFGGARRFCSLTRAPLPRVHLAREHAGCTRSCQRQETLTGGSCGEP